MTTRRACLKTTALLAAATPFMGATAANFSDADAAHATWQKFKKLFLSPDGRIADVANGSVSHTEGQGVAMLAAAVLGDMQTFDKVWGWTRAHLLRPDGLLSWRWVPGQGVTDKNNATDGDLYVSWALCEAALRFNRKELVKEAALVAKAVRQQCIVTMPRFGPVLLPGEQGFTSTRADGAPSVVVNMAYWVFPALEKMSAVDPNPLWQQVATNGLTLLRAHGQGRWGLPADWLQLSETATPWRERPARFGYEAIRIPLFLRWARQEQHPVVSRFAKFAARPGFPAWVGLEDNSQADYMAPAGFEAVAQLAREVVYGQRPRWPAPDSDYFSTSLLLLSQLSKSV